MDRYLLAHMTETTHNGELQALTGPCRSHSPHQSQRHRFVPSRLKETLSSTALPSLGAVEAQQPAQGPRASTPVCKSHLAANVEHIKLWPSC